MILWKWPSFSFEKNKSGIQTRFASVNVKYFKRPKIQTNSHASGSMHLYNCLKNDLLPPISSNFNRSSSHCSRNVSCTLYSYCGMSPINKCKKTIISTIYSHGFRLNVKFYWTCDHFDVLNFISWSSGS